VFCRDYLLGFPAPAVREKERQSFVFQPLFFDYDSYAIRPEYHAYLLQMARIVAGHSDIRILVVGHTDSDGSDAYNISLSQKRAEALIDFFRANGMNTNRISIDFKGEKDPVDSNETPEGKQRNRRVDFAFI
jgi:outer membrane protein OmpA-like peptidoglycan-associated protein